MAASVWMAWSIWKPFGAWIRRCSALTMPAVTVRSSPKGLPMATTASPTSTALELPRVSGVNERDHAPWIFRTAMSVEGSVPTTVASFFSSSEKLT